MLLPPGLWPPGAERPVRLRYGAGWAAVRAAAPAGGAPAAGTRQAPAPVRVAPQVLERLHIRTEPVYRLRLGAGEVEIGPVLGLLLGNRNHWYDGAYLEREPERVGAVYPQTGGLICAFSPRTVALADRCAYGLFYDPGAGRWRFGRLPLPAVIHRRSFQSDPAALQQLQAAAGVRIFNSRRFDKWELYGLLQKDEMLRRRVPFTVRVTSGQEVLDLVDRFGAAVLKPAHLSRGRGILFVERDGAGCRLSDCRQPGAVHRRLLTRPELQRFLAAEIAGRPYIGQQRIDLAAMAGEPFDLRVVMQRNRSGRWRCHGIECRVAAPGQLVTNLALGGRAVRLEDAVAAAFGGAISPAVAEGMVVRLCERFCAVLDQTGETFGEFGLDVALDRTGKAWLIEANVLPTFKGFRTLDPETYRRILAAPLLYASFLAGFGEEMLADHAAD